MFSQQDLTRSLAMIAFMVTERLGVRVVLGKGLDTACTNGKVIFIPAVPIKNQTEWALMEGLLYHEAAHVKDSTIFQRGAACSQILWQLYNILEDVRVEKTLRRPFPGVKSIFVKLCNLFYGKELDLGAQALGMHGVLNFLLYYLQTKFTVEHHPCSPVTMRYKELREALLPKFGSEFLDTLQSLGSEVDFCTSSQDAFSLAEKIVTFLKKRTPAPAPDEDSSQEGDGDSSPAPAPDEDSSSDGDTDSSPAPAQDEDSSQDGDSDSSPAPAQDEESEEVTDFIAQLEAEAEELCKDRELLRQWVENKGTVTDTWIPRFPTVQYYSPMTLAEEDVAGSARDLALLRSAMMADALKRSHSAFSGKLNPRRLAGLAAGTDYRVFQTKAPRKQLDTYIHLLVDASASMGGERMRQANLVFLGLQKSLETTPGIKIATTAFTTDSSGNPIIHLHSGKPSTGFRHGWGTPLGEALSWVLFRSLQQPEKRKVVFVITDGQPDSPEYATEVMQKMQAVGIQVIGIVINAGTNIFKTHVEIKKASELPAAIKSIWSNLLYPEC